MDDKQPNDNQSDDKQREDNILKNIAVSYLLLRRGIGILGISFPILLFLGCLIMGFCNPWQSSISCFYHTIMRNVFEGVLWIFAIFLLFYKYDTKDNIATTLAGICALGVALCPTHLEGCSFCDQGCYNNETVGYLHNGFAISFFAILAYISLKLFTLSPNNKIVYKTCGWIMIVAIVLIIAYKLLFKKIFPSMEKLIPVFWLETIALWAFGYSWLVKGKVELSDILKPIVRNFIKAIDATKNIFKSNNKSN